MELKLFKNEYEHLPNESSYNNNVYANSFRGIKLRERCREQYGTYDYYIIKSSSIEEYLGESGESIEDCDVIIDFKSY